MVEVSLYLTSRCITQPTCGKHVTDKIDTETVELKGGSINKTMDLQLAPNFDQGDEFTGKNAASLTRETRDR